MIGKRVFLISAKFTSIGDVAITQVQEQELLRRGYIITPDPLQADIVMICGGGLLYSRANEQTWNWDNKKIDLRIFNIKRALGVGAKLVVLGSGCQTIEVNKEDYLEVLKKAEFISLRDKGSIEEIEKNLSYKFDNAESHGDLVFGLYDKNQNHVTPHRNKSIVISIRTEEDSEVLLSTRKLLSKLGRYEKIWIPHGKMDYINYNKEWIPQYGGHLIGHLLDDRFIPEPHLYIELLRSSSGSITHRLHGLLMAILVGRPVLSLSEGVNKVEYQIERLFGKDRYKYIAAGNSSVNELLNKFNEMLLDKNIYDQFNEIANKEFLDVQNHYKKLEYLT